MESGLDIFRLCNLLMKLHQITHLQTSLFVNSVEMVCSETPASPFCELIGSEKIGRNRCRDCDKQAAKRANDPTERVQYRCHAGLIENILPIMDQEKVVAHVMFGQLLDDSPLNEQWETTRRLCAWHPHQNALKEAFFELPRLSVKQLDAFYEIVSTCVNDIHMEKLVQSDTQTDQERVKAYINSRYALPLTADNIAGALSMSKSRLYTVASQMNEGLSVNQMITKKRVGVAKELLTEEGASIRKVAEMVGIPDNNYFTKVFKRSTGMTPSQYRKEQRG